MSASSADARRAEQRLACLARAIEGEIIPRLRLAHKLPAFHPAVITGGDAIPDSGEVAVFLDLVMSPNPQQAEAYIQQLLARGVGLKAVFLDLLAPSARRLGEMWETDERDFTDVTIGLARLQQLLRTFGPQFEGEGGHQGASRLALLTVLPGEQHTFGLFMVEEFFRRAGWDVVCDGAPTSKEALDMVAREWFSLAGLSISRESQADKAASAIEELRRASRNPDLLIMVGGRVFNEQPDLADKLGADIVATDGSEAVAKADSYFEELCAKH